MGGGTRSRAPTETPKQALILIPQAHGCSLSMDLWQPCCPLPLCSLRCPSPHPAAALPPVSSLKNKTDTQKSHCPTGKEPSWRGKGQQPSSGVALHSKEGA